MSYTTLQAIREGAGLQIKVLNETPNGAIDGTNRDFVVKKRPIVDTDGDDEVGKDEVNAYVNGASVAITAVDATTGKVTLATAPALNTKVTLDYYNSPTSDEYVGGKQDEADSWIDRKLGGIEPKLPLNPVPGLIATVAEMYAAGLILTRDYGSSADTDLSSKDGYKKIATARELLMDYIQSVKTAAEQDLGHSLVKSSSDGNIFYRDTNLDDEWSNSSSKDDYFMRH